MPYNIQGEGSDEGELMFDVDFGKEIVHRAALLRELLAPIREDSIHVGRKLSLLEETTVVFDVDTKVEFNVVIGADGIHSGVRRFVLGQE